jgi:DNA-binding transcriptional ArsR family regulator
MGSRAGIDRRLERVHDCARVHGCIDSRSAAALLPGSGPGGPVRRPGRDAAVRAVVDALDSDLAKALSEPVRVQILKILLLEGALDVAGVSAHLSQDRSVVSRHLTTLHRAGLVQARKEGRNRIYAIDGAQALARFARITDSIRDAIAVCCPAAGARKGGSP